MSDKDNFARVISVLALIVSLLAILVSYIQQSRQFELQQREYLNISSKLYLDDEILLTDYNFGEMGQVIQFPLKLIVSNVGNRQLSIVSRNVSLDKDAKYSQYTGIDGGFLNSNKKAINLPITLESGESRIFYLQLGAIIPRKNYQVLSKLSESRVIDRHDAVLALGKIGVDIFGNSVKLSANDDDFYSLIYESIEKTPNFSITFSTGKGSDFVHTTKNKFL
jgi:hypothetical protein